MGRPPIGKQAMSGAERQRRYLDRLLKGGKGAIKPDDGALVQQLAQARARIAELEKTIASVTQRDPIQTQQQQRWTRKSADEKLIDPSSTTRPARSFDCNHSAMAGFAAAHG